MKAQIIDSDRMTVSSMILASRELSPEVEAKFSSLMLISEDIQVGYIDGKLACIWGLAPPTMLSDRAHLWLHVTDVVQEHTFVFIRQSQIAVKKMLNEYTLLTGEVLVGNDKAMKWLRWLGAEFGELNGNRIPFQIRRKDNG